MGPPQAGWCHPGHVRWLTMNCSMLSFSWAVLRSRSAVLRRASSLSESWARSAAISPCSTCSWDRTGVMSGEQASSPTSPQPGAYRALVLCRAAGQWGAPERSEEGCALLQDAVQGAGAAPEVPRACATQCLWERGAGAGAAGAPTSHCSRGPTVPSPTQQGSAGNSPGGGHSLPRTSPERLGTAGGRRTLFVRGPQSRVCPPDAVSPVLPTHYLLSRERAERWARQTHQLAGQHLPLQNMLLQGPVGVQAADDVSPCHSITLPHRWVYPTRLCRTSRGG